MGELTKFPWEQLPARPLDEQFAALQKDVAYIVRFTAILVRSKHEALAMLVNTPRGQIVPQGACRFTDGSTLEFQDIGAPQPNCPTMTIAELLRLVYDRATDLGLALVP